MKKPSPVTAADRSLANGLRLFRENYSRHLTGWEVEFLGSLAQHLEERGVLSSQQQRKLDQVRAQVRLREKGGGVEPTEERPTPASRRVEVEALPVSEQMPKVVQPLRPELSYLELIHRPHGDDKHMVVFARKNPADGQYQELCSLPADQLGELFPSIRDELLVDGMVSLQGMLPSRSESKLVPGARYPLRRADLTRCMTACYSDLDIYRGEISRAQAHGQLLVLQEAGEIPPISLILHSGQGLWALWLLREDEKGLAYRRNERGEQIAPGANVPVAWTSWDAHRWRKIQTKLHARLSDLCPDGSVATDLARVARIPGTINSKNGERVGFATVAFDEDTGELRTYTLSDLAERLGIREQQSKLEPALRTSPERNARKLKGKVGRWWWDLQRFHALWRRRGGFKHGTRNAACLIFARILTDLCAAAGRMSPEMLALDQAADGEDRRRREALAELARWTDQDIEAEVIRMARECEPGANPDKLDERGQPADDVFDPEADARRALEQVRVRTGIRGLTHFVIAAMLQIEPLEAEFLAQEVPGSGRTQPWPAAGGIPPTPTRRADRATAAAQRRRLIREMVQGRKSIPKGREIRAMLAGFHIDASEATISRDLSALGFKNPRSPKNRPRLEFPE